MLMVISIYRRRRLVEVIKPQSARVNPVFRAKARLTGAKVGDRLPRADLEGSVVAPGFVAEVGDDGVVGRGEYEGLLGKD